MSSRDPHFLVKLGVALSLFNSWVLFEETVVDRLGWWKHMPCYRVGRFCEWDVAAILAILLASSLAYPDTRAVALERLRAACGWFGCARCARGRSAGC